MPYVYKDFTRGTAPVAGTVPVSKSDVLWETFAQAYEENPIAAFNRWMELLDGEINYSPMSAEAARAKLKAAGLESHLKVNDAGISEQALNTLMFRKQRELRRQEIHARSPGGFGLGATQFGLAIATTFSDPIAAGLNFVPVIGELRYLKMLAGAKSAAGRLGVRAGVGAVEGAVGAAIYEPIIAGSRGAEQADYGMANSLMNVAFGAAGGAGLHTLVGSVAEIFAPPKEAVLPRATPARATALQAAGIGGREGPFRRTGQATSRPTPEPKSVREVVAGATPEMQRTGLTVALGQSETEGRLDMEPVVRGMTAPETPTTALELPRVTEGDDVEGLTVGTDIPNTGSIRASLTDYESAGLRLVPMDEFDAAPRQLFYAADDLARVERLAEEIKANGRIDPLIVVEDGKGYYVLEGGHRLGALHTLGVKNVPALVVRDLESIAEEPPRAVAPSAEPRPTPTPREPAPAIDTPEPETAPLVAEEGQTAHTSQQIHEDAEAEAQQAERDAKETAKRLGADYEADEDIKAVTEEVKKADRWARVAELATTCLRRGG